MIFFLFILLLEEDAGIACIYDVFGVKDVRPVNPLSAFHDVFLLSSLRRTLLKKLSPLYFPASAVLHVSCSFLSLSLSPNLSSLLPELARARIRQICDAKARFPRVFF